MSSSEQERTTMEDDAFDMTKTIQNADKNNLRLLRGLAIEVYANLEHRLCTLLSTLTGMQQDIAGIIFFKITSADVRDKIIETLLKTKKGDEYNLFWNSIKKMLNDVSNRRNCIVHWSLVMQKAHDGTISSWLTPGASVFTFNWTKTTMMPSEVADFILKCNFLAPLISNFAILIGSINNQMPEAWRQRWEPIIREAAVYPPPESHPLYSCCTITSPSLQIEHVRIVGDEGKS